MRARVTALLLATLLPMAGLGIYGTFWEVRRERAAAGRETHQVAARVAAQVAHRVSEVQEMLGVLARLPTVRTQNRPEIERLLQEILATSPHLENVLVADTEGKLLVSAVPIPSGVQVSFKDRAWFQEAVQSGQPTVAGFLVGRITRSPNAFIAYPVKDREGHLIGVVGSALRLASVRSEVTTVQIGGPEVWAVVDKAGLLLLHGDPAAMLGQPATQFSGTLHTEIPIPGTSWRSVVGFPEAVIAARARQALLTIGLPAALILFVATGVGFSLARNTWRPLQSLAAAVRRIGAGEPPTPLPVGAGGEVGEVATAIQDTLGALASRDAELVRRHRELTALLEATQAIGSSLDLEQSLRAIVQQAAAISGAPAARLFLLEEDGRVLRCRVDVGLPAEADRNLLIPVGESFSGEVAATGEPLAVPDCRGDSRLRHPEHALTYGLISYLGLPVRCQDQLFGVLVFNTTEVRTYAPEEISFLAAFAQQAGLAIQNARLYEEARRDLAERKQAEEALAERTIQLEVVRSITAEITRELDLSVLLGLITERAAGLVGAASGVIYLWDEVAQVLIPRAWHGLDDWIGEVRLRLGEGLSGLVAEKRQGLIENAYRTSARAHPLFLERTRTIATIGEPLLYRDRLLGVVSLGSQDSGRPFTQKDREFLTLFAAPAAIAIENARLYADLKRSYHDLQLAQDEMIRSEKLRALGQMAAGIAHDLNNMLAAILGQVELLRLRVTDPVTQAALTTLETAATDGADVVRRLQDFARQRGSSPLVPVDLGRLVLEAQEITRPRWKDERQRQGRVIEIRTDLENLPPVLGHAPEIREALTNLILNAVDAMPRGGTLTFAAGHDPGQGGDLATRQPGTAPDRPITQSPDGQPAAGWVKLGVSDTGIGMSEEIRRRIFDPFFTTKGVQGTGLGLSVVYGIMERHSGHIRVSSAPGRGTTVSLWFPAASAAAVPAPAARLRPHAPRRILVIDDDPVVRETVASLLSAVGHTVLEAADGAAGLARIADGGIDLVLTDLGMPEVTGWDVARVIKAQRPGVPVILLTGWGEHPTGPSGEPVAEGLVDRILGKPFRLEELLQVIAEATKGE